MSMVILAVCFASQPNELRVANSYGLHMPLAICSYLPVAPSVCQCFVRGVSLSACLPASVCLIPSSRSHISNGFCTHYDSLAIWQDNRTTDALSLSLSLFLSICLSLCMALSWDVPWCYPRGNGMFEVSGNLIIFGANISSSPIKINHISNAQPCEAAV